MSMATEQLSSVARISKVSRPVGFWYCVKLKQRKLDSSADEKGSRKTLKEERVGLRN